MTLFPVMDGGQQLWVLGREESESEESQTPLAEQQRGDVASSIECYMNENRSTSQDEARVHVRNLINSSWQDLNKECYAMTPLPRSIIKASLNLARSSQDMYQHGDDDRFLSTDELVQSLLVKPIHMSTRA